MRVAASVAMCCLLAAGALAEPRGTGRSGGTASGRHQGSFRTYGYGRYGGYGLGYFGLYDGYYEPFYPAASDGGSNVLVVYPPAAPPSPMAQPPAHPVIHEYSQPEDYGMPVERGSAPILYLIVFRDKNIRAAGTYWVEGGTLHYLDTDHKEQQAPLDSVDRHLSAELNRERHVPFNLP